MQWQDSVVAIWTPTRRASGFLFDKRGLIATSHRLIAGAPSVRVQLTPAVKVAANVLVSDPDRDVAVLWIDARAGASVRPLPLQCAETARAPVASGQKIFAVGAPLRQQKGVASANVMGVGVHTILSDLFLATGSAGGPVFSAGGGLVGITTVADEKDGGSGEYARVVTIADVCEAVASAERKVQEGEAPDGTHLPVEPSRPFPVDALKDAAEARASDLNPYHVSSSAFDIAFITPVLTYGAQDERLSGRRRSLPDARETLVRPLQDFGNWSEYVAAFPPVLLIRVTPKLVEGFWTKVARGAARTQGVSLPPIKHVTSGFSRMRAFCGDAEATPIHPFKLEQRIGESEAIYEGLYVFDPGALGPHCASVKLVLYSEKEPQKGDTRVVDPKVLQQVWQDFAPYRALK
jgi:hypothetical protein